MPQTRVEELTKLLLDALDDQGNVLNMVAVTEVVTQLESVQVTAEDLRVTRLGKHINSVRRQLTASNKALAKRMKELVKSWQQLLQAKSSNGVTTVPPPTNSTPSPRTSTPTPSNSTPLPSTSTLIPPHSTPVPPDPIKTVSPVHPNGSTHSTTGQYSSPVKHDPNKLTVTSSSPQTVQELFDEDQKCNGAAQESGPDPAKNRQKLLKLLSKVKKSSHPAAVKSMPDAIPEAKPQTGMFSNKNFVSVDESPSSSKEPSKTLPSEDVHSLRVSLPKDFVKRTAQTSRKTLSKTAKPKILKSLTISLPRATIKLKSELPGVKSEAVAELPLIVKYPLKYFDLKTKSDNPKPIALIPPKLPSAPVSQDHLQKITSIPETEKMEIDDDPVKVEPTLRENRIKEHCLADDFETLDKPFSNSQTVSDDSSVVILPYVFIDGLTDEII